MWKQRDIQLETPEYVEVDKYAKAIEPPNDKLICNNVPVSELIKKSVNYYSEITYICKTQSRLILL